VSSSLVLPQLLPLIHFGRTLYTTAGTIAVYDFDPKLPRSAVPVAGKTTLEEDGGNLAIALRDTLKDSSKRRKLNNLLRDILGFVEDLDVQQLPDKSLFFRVAERFAPGLYFPAPLVSDGTVKVIALLVALHFDSRETTVIEEPERSIHPYLIRRLVEEMREVSRRKQILITTHNPELVRHARLEELLLISRDKRGLSQVSRPAEKESVRFFLKQEMGIEEMYVQNLLELPS
jgi:predicted ATPase